MRNFFALRIVVFFLAILSPVFAIPQWSNITTTPEIHPYYQSRIYVFNVTWTNNSAIDVVRIEHNFTGSFVNSTMLKVGSTDVYSFNISNLSAGNYSWKGYANDSTGQNVSDIQTYIIKKGHTETRLLLNGTRGNNSYLPNVTANLTVDLFSANYTDISNPDFELKRLDNSSLFKNWFLCGNPTCTADTVDWPSTPVSSTSFSGSNSLLVNLTANSAKNLFISSQFKIPNITRTYILEVKVRPSLINQTCTLEEGCSFGVDFHQMDETGANYVTYSIGFNNTDSIIYDTDFITSLKYINDTGGWKRIIISYSLNQNPTQTFAKISFSPSATDAILGFSYIDDVSLKTFDERLNRTVFLNATFSGWTLVNGTSAFTNITKVPAATQKNNVTGFFSGDANFSNSNETFVLSTGFLSNLTVDLNQTSYSQASAASNTTIKFSARYVNGTTSIEGANCTVTNNQTSDVATLSFDSSSGNYTCTTNCPSTLNFYDVVKFTTTCSGNITFAAATNSTTTVVKYTNYLVQLNNQTYGESNLSAQQWLRYKPPAGDVLNLTKNMTLGVNSTDNDVFSFILEDSFSTPNKSLDRTIQFKGNASLRANLSASNASVCDVKLCFQVQDKSLNALSTTCGTKQPLGTAPAFIEQNVSLSVTTELSNYIAFVVRCDANNTLTNNTNVSVSVYYNYSSTPNIETQLAIPSAIKISRGDRAQSEGSYTINPNQKLNTTWNETIILNNTQPVLTDVDHSALPSIVTNLSRILNSSVKVFSSTGGNIPTTYSSNLARWTTEKVIANKTVSEILQYVVVDSIADSESLQFQKIGEARWRINVSTIFIPQISVKNVTVKTNFRGYDAFSGWTFNVTVTNSSGTFDISGSATKSGDFLVMPVTSLSSILYDVNATGLANGVACSADNQCGTGLCCSGACSATCVTTETVTVTSGGGGGGVASPDLKVEAPQTFGVVLGDKGSFVVNVSNVIKTSVLENVTLLVYGYLPGFVKIEPPAIDSVKFNETKFFTVTFEAPPFLTEPNYTVNINVTAVFKRLGTARNITKHVSLELFVGTTALAAGANETLESVENIIEEMKAAGFGTNRISILFDALKSEFVQGNLPAAQDTLNAITSLKERAFFVSETIKEVEKRIESARQNGLEVPNTERLYNLALESFSREDYEKAEERISNALLSIATETEGRINLVVYTSRNWPFILAAFLISLFLGVNAYRRISIMLIDMKLSRLRKEEPAIGELLEKLEKQYYKDKELSRDEYRKLKFSYNDRLSKIRAQRTKLISKRAGVVKAEDEIKQLDSEYSQLAGMIKELQVHYFREKKIPRSVYEARFKEHKSRLSEISQHMEFVKARASKETRGERIRRKVFRLFSIKR